jgi:hypothetical protein
MYKISQALGSNPATSDQVGATNMPLNQTAGEPNGVSGKEIISVLNKIVNFEASNKDTLISELESLLTKLSDEEIKSKISKIISAMHMASDPKKQTIDPETGKKDPGPQELAQKLIQIVHNKESSANNPSENNMEPKASLYNHKTAQKVIKKKKKTRGNPFRVLMGKVGKLLDHGVEKNDIVRYIAKEKKWDSETISKAVDIVKDYNKKLKTKKSEASTESRIVTSAYDYTTKPNFEKRSTPELIFRVCYLLELDDYSKTTPQGHGKDAADKKGVKEEIKQIKQALTTRGMSKDEMDKLGFGK